MNILKEIEEKEKYHKLLTNYVNDLKSNSNKDKLKDLSILRNFPISLLEENDIFYIGEMVEMLLPKYLENINEFGIISKTNNMPIFHNRYLIPIKDTNGLIINLVGYSNKANERYIYGNSKYYRRRDTLYGLENIHLAYKLGYAFLTEGITDCIRLRTMGYKNSFAMCGTHSSSFNMRILDRCRYGVIIIPDRDDPGKRALKEWKCNRSLIVNVGIQFKDVDEMCKIPENVEWFNSYMKYGIEWILKTEHKGNYCGSIEMTMI